MQDPPQTTPPKPGWANWATAVFAALLGLADAHAANDLEERRIHDLVNADRSALAHGLEIRKNARLRTLERLELALANLVNRALKYSEDAPMLGASRQRASVLVWDEGIGRSVVHRAARFRGREVHSHPGQGSTVSFTLETA